MMRQGWMVFSVLLATSAYAIDGAVLVPDTLPAHGKQRATLSVTTVGRYAVTVDNAQGSALQLVDRMRGPDDPQGEAGVRNGRIDAFFEAGAYQIITLSSEQGRGDARLQVHAFTEQERTPVALLEQVPVSTSLRDFEQRSYWLRVEREDVIALEAFGRSLRDMRIWRDGAWLVDAAPQESSVEPKIGQPLQVLRLAPRLTPGVYRVTVYGGGPALAWPEASPDHPLVLRYGVARAAVAARQAHTMDATGIARVRVPQDATYFRLELAQPGAATLRVEDDNADAPFGQESGDDATLDQKATVPMVDISRNKSSTAAHLVTVTAPAGTHYVLQHFETSSEYHFEASGNYYLSTLHAGLAADAIDATAVLTARGFTQHSGRQEEYVDARVVEFDPSRGWQRRFNLLDDATVLLRLPAATRLRVSGTETAAMFRIQPFVTFRPEDFREPAWRESGAVFDLNAGVFELQMHPLQRGILNLSVQAEATTISTRAAPVASSPVTPAARFGRVHLETGRRYTVYSNHQPGVANGVVLRRWPVDLAEPLPVAQAVDDAFEVNVHVNTRGRIVARDERGRDIPVRVSVGDTLLQPEVDRGDYTVRVDAPGDVPRDFALAFIPAVRASDLTRLAWLATAATQAAVFPTLNAQTPLFFDLAKNGQATLSVHVDTPALYRLESSGLLHTEGNLRTRSQPSLSRDVAGGAGRNFLLQDFLRAGDYQLTVALREQSAGHLGVRLAQSPIIDAGVLHLEQPARATLPAGQALRYQFHIKQRGTYQLRVLGLNRVLRVRLDDHDAQDAWPVIAPGGSGEFTRELEPGDYQLLVLPEPATARVVTLLREMRAPPQWVGHGPHHIELNQSVQHEWREPEAGAQRIPDQWDFVLPARAKVRVHVDQDMQALLTRNEPDARAVLATVSAAQPWEGELDAGSYRVATQSLRNNNRVNYTLGIDTNIFLDGMSKEITTPTVLPVSVGRDGLVEFSAFGAQDVRARLYDAQNNVIAENDDAADDWNFHIARSLQRGDYRLVVDPVGAVSGTTSVTMRIAPEHDSSAASWGNDNTITASGVHSAVLTASELADESVDAIYVGVDSAQEAGLEVEAEMTNGWQTLATQLQRSPWVVIPRSGAVLSPKRYRVRVWNPNQHGAALRWRAQALTLPLQTEKVLAAGGLAWTPVPSAGLRVARIDVGNPGVFRFDSAYEGYEGNEGFPGILVSSAVNSAAQVVSQALVTLTGTQLWLVQRDAAVSLQRIKAQRVVLKPTDAHNNLNLDIPAQRNATLQVATGADAAVVIAEAREGLPGVVATDADFAANMAVAQNTAVTLINVKTKAVRVWNTAARADALATTLRSVNLQQTKHAALTIGSFDGALAAQVLARHTLPARIQSARWTLDAGTGVVLRRAQRIVATLWSGAARYEETLSVDADEAWVFNSGSAPARYGVELTGAGAEGAGSDINEARRDFMLKATQPFEKTFSTAGVLRVNFDADASTLHVRGAEAVTIIDRDGRVYRSMDATVQGPGSAQIHHGVGALIAWFDAPRATTATQEIAPVTLPNTVALHGAQQLLRIEHAQPTLARLRSSTPLLMQTSNTLGVNAFAAFPHGVNTTLFAPAGASTLQLRALGAATLSGQLALLPTPLLEINEGAGAQFLLGAGDARGFVFDLAQTGDIGIGIRASADTVDAVLYASDGKELGHGLVLMKSLAPGRYYLAVSVAERAAPASVQPVLWGVSKRDTRPPQEIIRQYIESLPHVPLVSSQAKQARQARQAAATAPESMPNEIENNASEAGSEE